MATMLEQYRHCQGVFKEQLAVGCLPPEDILLMQELSYRICVLESFEVLCKSAPVTMDTGAMGYHYQLASAYISLILNERKFGHKVDEAGAKKREAAHQVLEQVVLDGRKRFSSFKATSQDQYKNNINNYILTVLPVWIQYRNTYINL